ncbi:hypothetical protein PG990_014511 [Apiospora arundinis]
MPREDNLRPLDIELGEVKPELGLNAVTIPNRIQIVTATGNRTWWSVLFNLWGDEATLAKGTVKSVNNFTAESHTVGEAAGQPPKGGGDDAVMPTWCSFPMDTLGPDRTARYPDRGDAPRPSRIVCSHWTPSPSTPATTGEAGVPVTAEVESLTAEDGRTSVAMQDLVAFAEL